MRTPLLLGIAMLFGMFGCNDHLEPPAATFAFTVEHVFSIKPPVDRVILVGTINEGQVRLGDSLSVLCGSGPISVVVEGIETPNGELKIASKGQQVGLRLSGITKSQPNVGDRIVGGRGS